MLYIVKSKKPITIPVRMDTTTGRRVKRAALRLRTSSAAVIRLAIASQLTAVESGHPHRAAGDAPGMSAPL